MKDSELAVMMAMGIFETLKDKKILDENDIIKSLIKLQKDGEKKK